jgi:heptosyltransferase-1
LKILLVKLSSLGDVVHTLPVVQDILAALPDAQIDWVVEPAFAPVLSLCPGVNRVVACELRRWRKALLSSSTRHAYLAFRAQLRLTAYDAVIDLQGLTKSALVAWLARRAPGGKRYALAMQTEGSGYEAPTRWVADVAIRMEPHIHAVQRSRELAAQALGYSLAKASDYGLKVPLRQQAPAPIAIENIANGIPSTEIPAPCVVFVHGTSRADKAWPLAHWVALGQRFNAAGYGVVLAHGNAAELATSQAIAHALNAGGLNAIPTPDPAALVLPTLALDALAPVLAACAGVIGVDSGVSHLAVALGLPHVQIYNFDTAWRTGPDHGASSGAGQVSVFAKPAPDVSKVWRAWLGCVSAAPTAGGATR